jgi:hypothetical protein
MRGRRAVCLWLVLALAFVGIASDAQAQVPAERWSVEIGAGFDNSISGNINSSGVGTINGQTTVITRNSYEDVYGTGLHLRFGGGYLLNTGSEVRVAFSFQSLDSELTPMGDIGPNRVYGDYADYQAFGIDFGLRQYHEVTDAIRAYGEGSLGIGFVDAIDNRLVAPAINYDQKINFFDQTTAFNLGFAVGAMVRVRGALHGFGQLGFRYVTGPGEVDQTFGTGLESINDNTARWTIPFVVGAAWRF